jgi:hypothetical protein
MVILIAISLPILFAFAALAVDMGFRYTRSRMLQAVADASVTVGMPSLVNKDAATGGTLATNLAKANGYSGSNAVIDTSVTDQLSVTVKATVPGFFSSIIGGGSTRLLTATAVGAVLNHPGPALLALGGCGSAGLTWNGNGAFHVNGPVESNGPITYSTGGGNPQVFNSTIDSACSTPSMGSGPITYMAGAPGVGGPYSDPFSSDTLAVLGTYCTVGDLSTARDLQFTDWTYTGANNIWKLNGGVYCSSGNMNLSGPGVGFVADGVTLITPGSVQVGATNGLANSSILTAAAGVPDSLAIYAGATTVGCAGQAINLGSQNLAVNGSVYAPNGCVNMGSDQGMAINGSVIGQSLFVGATGDWTLSPSGTVAGNNWRMLR